MLEIVQRLGELAGRADRRGCATHRPTGSCPRSARSGRRRGGRSRRRAWSMRSAAAARRRPRHPAPMRRPIRRQGVATVRAGSRPPRRASARSCAPFRAARCGLPGAPGGSPAARDRRRPPPPCVRSRSAPGWCRCGGCAWRIRPGTSARARSPSPPRRWRHSPCPPSPAAGLWIMRAVPGHCPDITCESSAYGLDSR